MFRYVLQDNGFCSIQKKIDGSWVYKFAIFPESEASRVIDEANSGKKTVYDFILKEEGR
jgi:hypothetical protein